MSFGIMGLSSTDPEYKEFERKWNQEQKQKQKVKHTTPATRAKGRFYSDLSEKEERKLAAIVKQYNQAQRKRFCLGNEFAGIEIR